ncbi:MAG: hypothetical protein ACRDHZ_15590, partial [Ktedonobacteraceae bacterium]
MDYIDTAHKLYPDVTLTVLQPEFVVAHWWEHLTTRQRFQPGIVVTNMPHVNTGFLSTTHFHRKRYSNGPVEG